MNARAWLRSPWPSVVLVLVALTLGVAFAPLGVALGIVGVAAGAVLI